MLPNETPMNITNEDRAKYPYHTDDSIIGIKMVQVLSDEQLELLKGHNDGIEFEELLCDIGPATNPSWLAARIAEELYERSLISETEFDELTR